jgi:hypothetical protein
MEQLARTIELRGLGEPITATEVKRTGKVCMYLRSDNVYEVFIVKVAKAKNLFGKQYEEREVYPTNEDFGSNAWCFSKEIEPADRLFNKLVNEGN